LVTLKSGPLSLVTHPAKPSVGTTWEFNKEHGNIERKIMEQYENRYVNIMGTS
jgi:hypothetical protein